jgi:hypothetical protein
MNGVVMWGLLTAICCAAGPAWATAPAPISPRDFQIGLAGCYQVGTWTPASVKVIGNNAVPAKLIVFAADADGQLVRSEGPVQTLVPGQEQSLTVRFYAGRQSGDITLRIEAGDYSTERKFRPGSGAAEGMPKDLQRGFRQDVPFWGLCGTSDKLFSAPFSGETDDAKSTATANNEPTTTEDQVPQILRLSIADMPDEAADLAALDLLVFAAGATGDPKDGTVSQPLFARLSDRQNNALKEWVQVRGGHLIISLGSRVQEFQASKLGQWLNLPLEKEDEVRQLGGLEAYSGHPQPLKIDRPVSIVQLQSSVSGQVLAQALGIPLLVQMPSGFGRVSFLAVDLDKPPLSTWAGSELMLRRLQRGDRGDLARDNRSQGTQLAKSGINDLSSQLYTAEEEFRGVNRVSLWFVMLLLATYIVIVGPLDYVLVHRWLKRPNLTWITFPLWVIGGGLLAVLLANSLNGRQLMAKQLELLDLDAGSGVVRARSWVTLYSPKTSLRKIELDTAPSEWSRNPQSPAFVPAVNWLALAENRVGGLYREGGVQLTQRQYRRNADGTGIEDYPLQVWSTGRFGGEWSAGGTSLVESKLISSGFGQLTGSIKLRLPETLEDCLLAYGNRVYFPVVYLDRKKTSNLPKFYTWDIGRGQPLEQRELRGYLTEIYTKQIKRDNSKAGPDVLDFSKAYDPSRRDLPYIMRMLSFHQAAGGRDYTGLRNDVLESLDLSQHLRMGRAVLMGRLRKSSAQWNVDGQPVADPEPMTYVRLVLSVEKDANAGYRPLEKPDEGIKGTPAAPEPATSPEKEQE